MKAVVLEVSGAQLEDRRRRGLDREIYRLAGSQYLAVQADADGWLRSEVLKVRFAQRAPDHVLIEDVDDPTLRTNI